VTTKLYSYYRQTLEQALENFKGKRGTDIKKNNFINDVLKNEIHNNNSERVIHSLKLIERIEPSLLEQILVEMPKNQPSPVQSYITEKFKDLSIDVPTGIFTPEYQVILLQAHSAPQMKLIQQQKIIQKVKSLRFQTYKSLPDRQNFQKD
jgi:hypothetical protein